MYNISIIQVFISCFIRRFTVLFTSKDRLLRQLIPQCKYN